jgi:hypothetical protein
MRNVTDKQQKRDPWTDPDPQPEDFAEFLAEVRPEDVQHFPGDRNAKSRFIDDEELERLLGPEHPLVQEAKAKASARESGARGA